MPIRPELRPLYPRHWTELSRRIRFARADGHCERCGRRHGAVLRVLPDGRWLIPRAGLGVIEGDGRRAGPIWKT